MTKMMFAAMALPATALGFAAPAMVLGFAAPAASAATLSVEAPGISPALAASPRYQCLRNFYVDATNGHDQPSPTRGQQADPWKSITAANSSKQLLAGDCVNVLPGTYVGSALNNFVQEFSIGGNANSAVGAIVYRSTVPQGAKLAGVRLQRPFVVLDGFDFDGGLAVDANGLPLSDAGVAFGCLSHHVTVINNRIHGFVHNGVVAQWADFVDIEHNEIIGNAGVVGSATKDVDGIGPNGGIQIFQPQPPEFCDPSHVFYKPNAADAASLYRLYVAFNVIADNVDDTTGLYTATGAAIPDRDGHGIVVEDTIGSETLGRAAYPYKSLVLGNVLTGNGGAAIAIHRSAHVTVANNTASADWTDPLNLIGTRAEFISLGNHDTLWVNNIARAVRGKGVFAGNAPVFTGAVTGLDDSNLVWTRNIAYGGAVSAAASEPVARPANLINVNPRFRNAAAGDFTLRTGSPALGTGAPEPFLATATPDIGAY